MKILIVGCGNIAKLHVKKLQKLNRIEIHLYSRSLNKAENFAKSNNCKINHCHSGELITCLESLKPDAVWLCTPPSEHLQVLELCLNQKIKVFCEKPVVSTNFDLQKLKSFNIPNNLVFVGENYYFKSIVYWINHVMEKYDLKNLESIFLKKCTFQSKKSWRKTESPMVEGGVHFCAMALELANHHNSNHLKFEHQLDRGVYTSTAHIVDRNLKIEVKYSWDNLISLPAGLGQKSKMTFKNGSIIFESNGLYGLVVKNKSIKEFKFFSQNITGFDGMYKSIEAWLFEAQQPYSDLGKAIVALEFAGI